MQKITACLWFNDQAEEAARFYTSIFKNSTIGEITHEIMPGCPTACGGEEWHPC
jgi:predicted 3-demethylubiquinone-9 3-methyltransferase (glyoxalase superfamily)